MTTFVPPARHLLRAKDLADARYFEPLGVDDLARAAGPVARALQPRVPGRVRRVAAQPTCSRAGWSAPRRCSAPPTAPSPTICFSVGLQSVGSFTTSFKRTYGVTPTAYRASFPPAADSALVPACVVRFFGRPQHSTFEEDSHGAAG